MFKANTNNNADNTEKGWFKFEREGRDFPFYKHNPHIGIVKWILLFIAPWIALIFAPPIPYVEGIIRLSIMLIIFGFIAEGKFGLIFKKFQKGDLKLIVIVVILGIFFALAMSMLVDFLGFVGHGNPVYEELDSLYFWFSFPFDIMIEEFLKLGPFLAILTLFYQKTKMRRLSIIVATIVTLAFFGLLHTDSVGNVIVALTVIGIPSVLDVYAYIKTKNIVVTYLTHILFDIALFSISAIFSLIS